MAEAHGGVRHEENESREDLTRASRVKQFLRKIGPARWAYRRLWLFYHKPSVQQNVRTAVNTLSGPPDRGATDPCWENPFAALRESWAQVPTDCNPVSAPRLLELGDAELMRFWESAREAALTANEHFCRRGWYHLLYEPLIRGARVMDFGSGLGMDGLSFAPIARHVTCVDLTELNLALLRRIARLKGLTNVDFVYLENFDSFRALGDSYDVILACGSLHNAPQRITRCEIQELAPRLKIGGRWLQLIYPKRRWQNEGKMPFKDWGIVTEGYKVPWVEWYDTEKLLPMFAPLRFEVVLAFNFYRDWFNWFDLVRRA